MAQISENVLKNHEATIAPEYPGQRGFTRRNFFRMRQFFEGYQGYAKVSALLRQLPWTHHLLILGQAKLPDERKFCMLAAIQHGWSSRELERQIRTGAALRSQPATKKVSPVVTQIHPTAVDEFKSAYSLEFLGLAQDHSESDLHGALLRNLGRFINELGRDFCFVGSEYQTLLPSKALLRRKLHEPYARLAPEG